MHVSTFMAILLCGVALQTSWANAPSATAPGISHASSTPTDDESDVSLDEGQELDNKPIFRDIETVDDLDAPDARDMGIEQNTNDGSSSPEQMDEDEAHDLNDAEADATSQRAPAKSNATPSM